MHWFYLPELTSYALFCFVFQISYHFFTSDLFSLVNTLGERKIHHMPVNRSKLSKKTPTYFSNLFRRILKIQSLMRYADNKGKTPTLSQTLTSLSSKEIHCFDHILLITFLIAAFIYFFNMSLCECYFTKSA